MEFLFLKQFTMNKIEAILYLEETCGISFLKIHVSSQANSLFLLDF